MDADTTKKRLASYLQITGDTTVKVICKSSLGEVYAKASDWDDDFIEEMGRRSNGFVGETVEIYTLEESKPSVTEKHQKLVNLQ